MSQQWKRLGAFILVLCLLLQPGAVIAQDTNAAAPAQEVSTGTVTRSFSAYPDHLASEVVPLGPGRHVWITNVETNDRIHLKDNTTRNVPSGTYTVSVELDAYNEGYDYYVWQNDVKADPLVLDFSKMNAVNLEIQTVAKGSPEQPETRPLQTYLTVNTQPRVEGIAFTVTEDNVPAVVHESTGTSPYSNFFELIDRGYTVQLETPGYRIVSVKQLYQSTIPATQVTDTSFHVDLGLVTRNASGPTYEVAVEEVPVQPVVRYDANGGTFDEDFDAEFAVDPGTEITLPFQFQSGILRDGYYFDGWRVQGTEDVLRPGAKVTVNEDTVFEAVWTQTDGRLQIVVETETPGQPIPSSVKLIGQDGTEYDAPLRSYSNRSRTYETPYLYNGTYTLVMEGLPEANITMRSQSTEHNKNEVIVTPISGTEETEWTVQLTWDDTQFRSSRFTRLFVELDPIETVQYTLDANGGTFGEGVQTEFTVETGTEITLPFQFQTKITRLGYYFDGWRVQGTEDVLRPGAKVTVNEDTVFEAVWTQTDGRLQIVVETETPGQPIPSSVKLIGQDGTEYDAPLRSYSNRSRTYESEFMPNGTYTLVMEGLPEANITMRSQSTEHNKNSVVANPTEGTNETEWNVTVKWNDEDFPSSRFTRLFVELEPVPEPVDVTYRFDANGGRFRRGADTVHETQTGTEILLPTRSALGLARPGYVFEGWQVRGTQEILQPGTVYTIQGYTVFDAVWRAVGSDPVVDPDPTDPDPEVPVDPEDPEVPVDPEDPEIPVDPDPPAGEPVHYGYDAGGGRFRRGAQTEIDTETGVITLATRSELGLARPGYSFVGWRVRGTVEILEPGSAYTLTGPVVFEAVWTQI